MTVEAAVVMPVFFICMLLVLMFVNAYGWSARAAAAMGQTAQEMAIAAYVGGKDEKPTLPETALSIAYAQLRVTALAGESISVKNENLLLSSIMEQDDRISLVTTYQINHPFGIIRLPGTFWIQKACARAWTGRAGSGGKAEEQEGEARQTVYMTASGRVYHTDPDCSHIKLTIMAVPLETAKASHNVYREKYHPCEYCKGGSGTVYITTDGNRYHASLDCQGLKRSVREVDISEVGDKRCCADCAKRG